MFAPRGSSFRDFFKRFPVRGLLDAVFPRTCLFCNKLLADDVDLCAACLAEIGHCTEGPYCTRCGKSQPPFADLAGGCAHCRDQRLPYEAVVRVGTYTGALRSLMRVFKYGGREELDRYFSRELARRVARSSFYEQIDAVVAVPTCWQHRLRRPFHPALLLGRQVARRCGLPFAQVLKRVGGGPHQAGQPATVRVENVRGKFRLVPGCRIDGARLCLVDDVMTSGATAGECSKVLKRAGAAAVYVAILARAADDPVALLHA